jgi:hypothetical protein
MNRDNNQFEEEPPSYDHAFQANIEPENKICQYGKYQDASFDSYEKGEMFIQAFSTQIGAFPLIQAQQVGQQGFLNTMQIDTMVQNNELFKHPQAHPQRNPAIVVPQPDQIQFWPAQHFQKSGPLEDFDVSAQGTHPLLSVSEYNKQTQYQTTTSQHYFEMTVQQAGPHVVMAIGLCTRPYPIFRMPGWNKYSVGYHSDDGHKFCDDATGGQAFGPSWTVGDTVGCGYCPETGNVFYTLNGLLVGHAFSGLQRHYYFPSIGADGPALIQVNFGKQPFKYQVDNWVGQYI